jgi:HEAT repeat protein
MNLRRRIAFTISLLIVIAALTIALAAILISDKEPTYEGRSLTEWLKVYDDGLTNAVEMAASRTAITKIGTNALPSLMTMVSAKDFPIKKKIIVLTHNWPLAPQLLIPAFKYHERAWMGFSILGGRASPAVPALTKLLDDKDREVRLYAAEALGRIGPAASNAIPALTRSIQNGDSYYRAVLRNCLHDIDGKTEVSAGATKSID